MIELPKTYKYTQKHMWVSLPVEPKAEVVAVEAAKASEDFFGPDTGAGKKGKGKKAPPPPPPPPPPPAKGKGKGKALPPPPPAAMKKGAAGKKSLSKEVEPEPLPKSRIATIGITEVMSEKLGYIDTLDLPKVGDDLDIGNRCIHFHQGPFVRYLPSPLTGCVVEVNSALLEKPNLVHLDPYTHWLFRIEFEEPEELDLLLTADRYNHLLDMQ